MENANGLSIWCTVSDTRAPDRLSDIPIFTIYWIFRPSSKCFLELHTQHHFNSVCIILGFYSWSSKPFQYLCCCCHSLVYILVLGQRWKSYLALTSKPIIVDVRLNISTVAESQIVFSQIHAWVHIITITSPPHNVISYCSCCCCYFVFL